MKSINDLLQTDFLDPALGHRAKKVIDWNERLIRYRIGKDLRPTLVPYAAALEELGLPLNDPDFIELLYAYFGNVEDAILITLDTAKRRILSNPTSYFVAVLRSGSRWKR